MITIESLVEQGANVKLEVTPADLKMFAEAIERIYEEISVSKLFN